MIVTMTIRVYNTIGRNINVEALGGGGGSEGIRCGKGSRRGG